MGSLASKGYLGVVPFLENEREHRYLITAALNNALQGKLNNTLDVALKKDAVSTTVSDARVGPNSAIALVATSARGATALTVFHISTRTSGSFVISHVSTSTSDCTAVAAILG